MAAGPISERNQDATIYVGGLDEKVTESLLWELFVQAGPVVNVHMPKDRVTMMHQGYGFVEFLSEDDADYSIKIMNMIKLFGKPVRVNKASAHQKNLDVGANIFIGNLDPEVDEKLLYDTFSAFGVILTTPKIQRDPETGNSKGFAFINYASFEASDAAIEAMNGEIIFDLNEDLTIYLLQVSICVIEPSPSPTHSRRTPRVRDTGQQRRGCSQLRILCPRLTDLINCLLTLLPSLPPPLLRSHLPPT